MRCQVGDIAILIKASRPNEEPYNGRLVEVAGPSVRRDWEIRAIGFQFPRTGREASFHGTAYDWQLRPIRPGAGKHEKESANVKEEA